MDDLTPEQIVDLHGDLLALKTDLRAVLDGLVEGTRPVEPDPAIGRISRMDAIQIQQMAQASKRTAKRRLQQVEAALRRVDAGEFGECYECGGGVGYRRLKARPESAFCVHCQGRRETS
jgi:DnaK suppressor protein